MVRLALSGPLLAAALPASARTIPAGWLLFTA